MPGFVPIGRYRYRSSRGRGWLLLRHQSRRSNRLSAGDSVEVPRLSCRAVEWVDRGSTESPFVQIGFAQNNGSRFFQLGDDSSVEVRNPIVEHLRSRSGPNPMGRNVVFNGEWNTVERAAIVTSRNLILCSLCLGQGVFRRNRSKREDQLTAGGPRKGASVRQEKFFAFRRPEPQRRS